MRGIRARGHATDIRALPSKTVMSQLPSSGCALAPSCSACSRPNVCSESTALVGDATFTLSLNAEPATASNSACQSAATARPCHCAHVSTCTEARQSTAAHLKLLCLCRFRYQTQRLLQRCEGAHQDVARLCCR